MELLNKYKSGDQFAVWHLLRFGPTLMENTYLLEASKVAREFAEIALSNLLDIKSILNDLGYEFQNPEHALLPASCSAKEEIEEFENKHGQLPVIIREWYSVFDSIDFSQTEAQGKGLGEHSASPVKGLGVDCRLVIRPLRECSLMIEKSFRDKRKKFLPLGGYATNCDPKGIDFPSSSFDTVYYDSGAGEVGFGDAVRFILSGCGFDYWKIVHDLDLELSSTIAATPDYLSFYNRTKPLMRPL